MIEKALSKVFNMLNRDDPGALHDFLNTLGVKIAAGLSGRGITPDAKTVNMAYGFIDPQYHTNYLQYNSVQKHSEPPLPQGMLEAVRVAIDEEEQEQGVTHEARARHRGIIFSALADIFRKDESLTELRSKTDQDVIMAVAKMIERALIDKVERSNLQPDDDFWQHNGLRALADAVSYKVLTDAQEWAERLDHEIVRHKRLMN